jgi:hypothetical protein
MNGIKYMRVGNIRMERASNDPTLSSELLWPGDGKDIKGADNLRKGSVRR